MNQRVVIILSKTDSGVFLLMIAAKISCTPSCSEGSIEVHKGVLAENQTALAKLQWKNKWASFSTRLQWAQLLLILFVKFPALAPVAMALLISLQAKHFMLGAKSLRAQTLSMMFITCAEMVLVGRAATTYALGTFFFPVTRVFFWQNFIKISKISLFSLRSETFFISVKFFD